VEKVSRYPGSARACGFDSRSRQYENFGSSFGEQLAVIVRGPPVSGTETRAGALS
jgi:hypothetical protein